MKTINCKKCEIEIEYKKNRKYCKICLKERKKENDKKYYQKNIGYYQKQNKRYHEENKEGLKEYQKEYMKKYNQKNKEKLKEYSKRYYQKNKEKVSQKNKEYNQRTWVIKRRRKQQNKYTKEKKKEDIQYLLRCRLRRAISDAFRHYTRTGKVMTSKKYGIDYEKIITHLKPFPKDIENYHIDHIIPLSKFDFNNPQEVKWAFAPENHQWLTAKENLSKGNKKIYIHHK